MNNIHVDKNGNISINGIYFSRSGWSKIEPGVKSHVKICAIGLVNGGLIPLTNKDEETVRQYIALRRLKDPTWTGGLAEKGMWDKVRKYQTSCFSSTKDRDERRADFRAKHIHLTKTGIPVIRVMDIHKRQSVNISHAGLHDSGISLDFPIVAFATTGFGYVPTLDEYEPTLELFLDMCHTFGYRNNAKIAGKEMWQKVRESYWRNPRGERW